MPYENADLSAVDIELTQMEQYVAAQIGIARTMRNRRLGNTPRFGQKVENTWANDIEGAMGEMALAKFLGVYWTENSAPQAPDVGENDEVRTTEYVNGHLLLHKCDHDDRRYWLLTGVNGKYVVRGWLFGREKDDDPDWWRGEIDRPCYYVPQDDLRAPEEVQSHVVRANSEESPTF
jgi:hypothetical protein